jgi:G3E family GTPase
METKTDESISIIPITTRVPVTIISGFLGAGKTSLLRHVLTVMHGKRIAVIENEFADEIGIESLILKNGLAGPTADGFYELQNGCLCCTTKDDLVIVLEKLIKRSKEQRFDAVLIETSGMANPGPVAATFWSDTGDLDAQLELDGIVTIVDAVNILKQLGTRTSISSGGKYEAEKQIGCADVILLNKTDLVSYEEIKKVEEILQGMNSAARIIHCQHSMVNLDLIMRLRAFDVTKWTSSMDNTILEKMNTEKQLSSIQSFTCDQKEYPSHKHSESCIHDTSICTIVIRRTTPVDLKRITQWIGKLVWPNDDVVRDENKNIYPIIFRGKGVLCILDTSYTTTSDLAYLPERYILQSVHEQFDIQPCEGIDGKWEKDVSIHSKIILIGKNLNKSKLEEEFVAL